MKILFPVPQGGSQVYIINNLEEFLPHSLSRPKWPNNNKWRHITNSFKLFIYSYLAFSLGESPSKTPAIKSAQSLTSCFPPLPKAWEKENSPVYTAPVFLREQMVYLIIQLICRFHPLKQHLVFSILVNRRKSKIKRISSVIPEKL